MIAVYRISYQHRCSLKRTDRREHTHTYKVIHLLAHSCSRLLIHSLTYTFTNLRAHSLTNLLTRSLTHELIHSRAHSLTYAVTLIHTLSHSLSHSLTHSLTHSLADWAKHNQCKILVHFKYFKKAGGTTMWESTIIFPHNSYILLFAIVFLSFTLPYYDLLLFYTFLSTTLTFYDVLVLHISLFLMLLLHFTICFGLVNFRFLHS